MFMPTQTIYRICIAICFLVLPLTPIPLTWCEEVVSSRDVIAIGIGSVYREDVASARSQAIANSLVSAVSQVTSDLLPFDTMNRDFQVLNEILYSRTNKFIQGYKVLKSTRSGNRYSVMVQARVSTDLLEAQLSSVGILLLKNSFPNVLFFMTETVLSDPLPRYWWDDNPDTTILFSQNMMSVAFQKKGFTIIDPSLLGMDVAVRAVNYRPDLSKQEAIALGALFQADVVIVGASSAQAARNRMGDTIGSYQADVRARAIRTDSGVVIGETEQSFVAISDDPTLGGADALAGAGRLAGTDLSEQIASVWQDKIKSLIGIDITIRWGGDLANLVAFRKAIIAIPGTKRMFPQEMTADDAILAVDFEGDEKDLANALMVNTFPSFGIHIFETSALHLGVELVPPEANDP